MLFRSPHLKWAVDNALSSKSERENEILKSARMKASTVHSDKVGVSSTNSVGGNVSVQCKDESKIISIVSPDKPVVSFNTATIEGVTANEEAMNDAVRVLEKKPTTTSSNVMSTEKGPNETIDPSDPPSLRDPMVMEPDMNENHALKDEVGLPNISTLLILTQVMRNLIIQKKEKVIILP